MFYQIKKKGEKVGEVSAVSSNQALYKFALEKTPVILKGKEKKQHAGNLYRALLESCEAIRVIDPNQMELFQ